MRCGTDKGSPCSLEDGRVETNTNTVERGIRPIKLGRKSHLFAGSDGGAESSATIASAVPLGVECLTG
jgi:transposase